MAARAKGGTSALDVTVSASTRPLASLERHALDARRSADRALDDRARLVQRDRLLERPHLGRHVDAGDSRGPASAVTYLQLLHDVTELRKDQPLIASRTASGEPGSTKIALRPTVPAVARLIIAAEPISSKLSIRNSSPKPSSRFSSSAVTASNVAVARADAGAAGRDDDLRRRRRRAARARRAATCAGSSLTMAWPETVWPALLEQLANRAAAGVGGFGARVADRQHEAGDRCRRLRLVFDAAHCGLWPDAEAQCEAR